MATKDKPIFIGKEASFGASLTQIESNIMAQRYLKVYEIDNINAADSNIMTPSAKR